jgi:iron(III) transport system substrate-binding protein
MALPTAAQDNAQTLVVYSGRTEGLIGPILEQFTQDTGIPVEVRYGGTAEMAATILEEGDNSPADVFIAQDASALGALAAEGRLIALPADILEQVQPQYESAAGEWVGISGRARALVYNTELVQAEALPASLLGLTQPEWQGKVGWAPPNGSFQSNITAMRLLLGEDATAQWLTDMVNNGAVSYENNDAITQAVIDGEISVGLVNHYYVFEFKEQFPDAPIDIHYFEDGDLGNLINGAGAGIITTSKQPDLAQSLIRYLLGETAQTYFAETTAEYPLVAGVPENPQVRPLAEIKGPEIDLSSLSDLQTTLDMLRDTGVTP